MKSTGEILKELGFNRDAPIETQKAFLKHLIKSADINSLKRKENLQTKVQLDERQLSFNFDVDSKISESA